MPKKLSSGANTTSIIFPLGIAYVSAAMKRAGFNVYTTNLDFPEGDTFVVLQELIPAHSIDVICTGGLSLDCHKIIDVITAARMVHPDILTVIGGGIISSDPETAMRVLGADIGVIGEGEDTMCELARALDHNMPYGDVAGIIYKNDANALVTTPQRADIADIDRIPFPDFEGFNYRLWTKYFGGAGVLLSDRSCPFCCTFCFHPTGSKYRQRSLDNIFEEIDYQINTYHLQSIGLTSELFATTRERISDFCGRIKDYKLSWSCCLRVSDVDLALLRQMREAGCNLICYGLESGDDSILRSMRKGIRVEQIERALDLSYEAGISTEASNFIFGDINETTETVANTVALWWRYNKKTHINLSLIQTYPGTYLYEYACQNGIIRDKAQFLLDDCPIINVSKLSPDEFHDLTSMVAEMRMHPHIPAESVHIEHIDDSGACSVTYKCRKCGATNAISSWFWFTETRLCSSCGIKNEVDPFRAASHLQDALCRNLPDVSPVALWGAGGVCYKLMQQYSGLADDRFLLVDANPEQHGLKICGKAVNSPDIIAAKGIKIVIIMALSRRDEIHAMLGTRYPAVDDILIPAFEITGNAIVPYFKPFPVDARSECAT